MKIAATLLALGLLSASLSCHAVKLIKDEEARLPAANPAPSTRGITRGPGIRLLAPDAAAGAVKSPFNLKLAFEPRGGAKIDPASVKMTYLKATPVDLLDRVRTGLSAGGIELAGAEAPPGEHPIQVTVQDSEGRKTTTVITLSVAK
jgi:hypothetical protein